MSRTHHDRVSNYNPDIPGTEGEHVYEGLNQIGELGRVDLARLVDLVRQKHIGFTIHGAGAGEAGELRIDGSSSFGVRVQRITDDPDHPFEDIWTEVKG
ncbi:MAG: hypothetical protein AAB410_01290 [Patescibacteria group bacterium]